jgi:hypothetical protein
MADVTKKLPFFLRLFSRMKGFAKDKMDESRKRDDGSYSSYLSRNTQSLQRGSAAVAGAVAGSALFAGKAGVSFLRLAGHGTWIFTILAAVLHVLYINAGVVSLVSGWLAFYLCLGIVAALFVWNDPNDPFPLKRLVKFLLLALAAYLLPLLITQADKLLGLPREVAAMTMIMTPLLVIYAFIDPGDVVTRWLSGLYFLALSLWLLFGVVFPLMAQNAPQYSDVLLSPGEMRSAIVLAFSKTREPLADIPKAITETRNDLAGKSRNVTQEVFRGQVDQTQGVPLGITLIEAKPLLQRFSFEGGDDIIATASIRSRTADDSVYAVSNKCYLLITDTSSFSSSFRGKHVRIDGTVSPEKFEIGYTGEQYDQRLIECVVPHDAIKKERERLGKEATGTRNPLTGTVYAQLVFNTTFDFSTSGYMTYAFMDKDLFSSLRADGKEPAREIGLPSNRQQARYTPGPVMIGMPADTIPYPVDSASQNPSLPSFGVTFGNAFAGRGGIQSFGETVLYVPRQLRVSPTCTPKEFTTVQNTVSDPRFGTDYTRYDIKGLKRQNQNNGYATDGYTTLRCPLSTASGGDLLGPSGAGIYTLFLTTRYTYAIDTSTPLSLMFPSLTTTASEGFVVNVFTAENRQGCTTMTPTCVNDQCYCYYKDSSSLGFCSYQKGEKSNLEHAAAAVNNQGVSGVGGCSTGSEVPLACANAISCTGTACTCIYPKVDHSVKCTWTISTPTQADCKPLTSTTSEAQ